MAFLGNGLTAIIIPESVRIIGSKAFCGSKLKTVDIGPSVTTMGEDSFESETITSFTCRCATPPTIVSNVSNYWDITSDKVYQNVPLYVPKGSAELYRNKFPWDKFVTIKEFAAGDGVETVSIDALDLSAPVEVYDLHGRRLGSDLGALPSGIYLVKQGSRLSKVAR